MNMETQVWRNEWRENKEIKEVKREKRRLEDKVERKSKAGKRMVNE